MMRGREMYATAVRRRDNSVVVETRPVPHFLEGWKIAKWPLIRGTFLLVETLTLGMRSLQFSGNVAIQDEMQRAAEEEAEADEPPAEPRRPWVAALVVAVIGVAVAFLVGPRLAPWLASKLKWFETADDALLPAQIGLAVIAAVIVALLLRKPSTQAGPDSLSDTAMWLAMAPAFAFGIFLFVLLPSWVTDVVKLEGDGYGIKILKNLIEGVIRLSAILGYIAVISLIGQIRRVFQYHGAEHKVINTLEIQGHVDVESAAESSPLHPRCGTAFLLLFIVLKIIVGCFFGWPVWYWRLLLRLAMVPVVAALAYETTRLAGRHRDSFFSKALSGPGLLLQRMTTRQPEKPMLEVALYALAAVAPEVPLPEGLAAPQEFVPQPVADPAQPQVEDGDEKP